MSPDADEPTPFMDSIMPDPQFKVADPVIEEKLNWLEKVNAANKRKALFEQELTVLINKFSMENGSGTPDYVISHYLMACLNTFESAVGFREQWYGRAQDDFGMPVQIPQGGIKEPRT